jgi:hypothetical protein
MNCSGPNCFELQWPSGQPPGERLSPQPPDGFAGTLKGVIGSGPESTTPLQLREL